MKRLRIGTIVVALSLLALPAQAAIIGLLGGDFDPPPINDGLSYDFGDCDDLNNYLDTSEFFELSMPVSTILRTSTETRSSTSPTV